MTVIDVPLTTVSRDITVTMGHPFENYQRSTITLQVVSAITTAVALFVVFRLTAKIVSVDLIGIWSLVGGLFLVARVSDSGAGNNISRVIAARVKAAAPLDLRNLICASISIACLPSMVVAFILTPAIGTYIGNQYGSQIDQSVLWALVWLGLMNTVILILSNILLAVCEGVFQLNFKSVTLISSNLIGVLAALPLLSITGPIGIGLIYNLIAAVQLILATFRIFKLTRSEPKLRFSKIALQITYLWRENLQLSAVSLIRLTFEPATKLFLSFFAPLLLIAQFELAIRVTTQVRVIFQSALQPLLAVGAREGKQSSGALRMVFLRNDKVLSRLSLGALVAQIFAAPAIQVAGLGTSDIHFTLFFVLLAVGNALNTMGLSGYYWQLTSGLLYPLLRVQTLMAGVNLLLGLLAVSLKSPSLVVASYSAAFAIGGLISRSFLSDLSGLRIVGSVGAVVAAAGLATGTIIVASPRSLPSLILFVSFGALIAGLSLYGVRNNFRRGSVG
jgi:hypothetical protein